MGNLFVFLEGLDGLKEISKKIIPSDIWSFVIQLTATAILVFILAKFLVKPAREFVEKRQAIIQANIDEAEAKNKEAEINLAESRKNLDESRITSKQIVETAKISALSEKNKIIEETKQEVASFKDKAYQDIESEKIRLKEELTNEVVDVAILAASKVVTKNISKKDNEQIIEDFLKDNK